MEKKPLIIGCSIAAGVMVLGIIALVCFLLYMGKDPELISVRVESPADVAVGETFDLKVHVTNGRKTKPMALSDIDLANEYLAGFTLVSTDPAYRSSMDVPVDESRSFTFTVSIPPETTRVFTFRLRAETAGLYRGDADVCEGMRFLSDLAQTRVREK